MQQMLRLGPAFARADVAAGRRVEFDRVALGREEDQRFDAREKNSKSAQMRLGSASRSVSRRKWTASVSRGCGELASWV